MNLPYSDDLMVFDEETFQYILTEEAMRRNGCELRANLAETNSVSADLIIHSFLRGVSEVIYAFIHEYNTDNEAQDWIIANSQPMRKVMYRALSEQAKYNYLNGALEFSAKKEEQEMAIPQIVKSILKNSGILYTGFLRGNYLGW